ncbi:hypothetical protein [Kiloniella spongiae]|uniref:hypothetical protein n=1 Tax=Kiloniella spongiae TaxID=1489064 RepID=UPI0012E09182|nr:hypothetical protein [Kiloniella spongiae]
MDQTYLLQGWRVGSLPTRGTLLHRNSYIGHQLHTRNSHPNIVDLHKVIAS